MRRILFVITLLSATQLTAGRESHQEYLDFINEGFGDIGNIGSASSGEIELLLNEYAIHRAEQTQFIRLISEGVEPEKAIHWAKAGIVHESPYWYWVRDPVKFPDGSIGIYGRIIPKQSTEGTPYAAVLPVLDDGRFVLNVSYRHATRHWEMELPGGTREGNESPEETARRELFEETGFTTEKLIHLGNMTTDPGMTGVTIPVFLAPVSEQQAAPLEFGEAIAGSLVLSIDEIHEGLLNGHIMVNINEVLTLVYVRDSLITFSLYQAMLRAFPAKVFKKNATY